mgnify:CR=1 FL=1
MYADKECKQELTVYDKAGNKLDPIVSGDGGIVKFYGLSAGTYYLKETKALNDYVLDAAEHKLVIGEKESDRVQVQFDGRDYTFSLDENGTLNFGFTIYK